MSASKHPQSVIDISLVYFNSRQNAAKTIQKWWKKMTRDKELDEFVYIHHHRENQKSREPTS